MILSNKRITKVLIRLRICAGWSAALMFANHRRQVFSSRGPYHILAQVSLGLCGSGDKVQRKFGCRSGGIYSDILIYTLYMYTVKTLILTFFITAKFFTTSVILAQMYQFSLNLSSLQQKFGLTSNYLGTNAI